MVRRSRLFIALAGMAVALIAPQTAYADSANDSTTDTQATVWYDPITHPIPHDLAVGSPVVRTLATGGGCTDKYGGASCISYKGSTTSLNADFYVTSWDHVDISGTGYVYIEANGTTYYRYTALTNFIGHYPVSSLGIGSSSGYAWTVVDFYDNSGNWLNSVYSPNQWYP